MLNRRDFIAAAAASFGAAAAISSGETQAAEPVMSLNVVYLNHDGAKFDAGYYRSSHIPLVTKVMEPANVTLIEHELPGAYWRPVVQPTEQMNAPLEQIGPP